MAKNTDNKQNAIKNFTLESFQIFTYKSWKISPFQHWQIFQLSNVSNIYRK